MYESKSYKMSCIEQFSSTGMIKGIQDQRAGSKQMHKEVLTEPLRFLVQVWAQVTHFETPKLIVQIGIHIKVCKRLTTKAGFIERAMFSER